MKVISNTLDLTWESWDDPGDYPNALASGPLPSFSYPVVEGELVVEAENQEDLESFDCISDWIWDFVDIGLSSATWKSKIENNRCTIWVEDCTADPPYQYEPEPSYEEWDDS